ncbi:MAG: type 1 glutamine amidotransferase [Hyphomicrobiales bacterium]
MKTIHLLQHNRNEPPPTIIEWGLSNNINIKVINLNDKDLKLPESNEVEGLIIMGGPMNAYQTEEYPWLIDEKRLIQNCIKDSKKVLGICLGAQLVAEALGAKVYYTDIPEVGWWPIYLTDAGKKCKFFGSLPSQFTCFHFHEQIFDLPKGAYNLAETNECPSQGFVYNDNVLALQFHLEIHERTIQNIGKAFNIYTRTGIKIQSKEEVLKGDIYIPENKRYMNAILTNFFI